MSSEKIDMLIEEFRTFRSETKTDIRDLRRETMERMERIEEKVDDLDNIQTNCATSSQRMGHIEQDVSYLKEKMSTKASKEEVEQIRQDGIKLHTTIWDTIKVWGSYILIIGEKIFTYWASHT